MSSFHISSAVSGDSSRYHHMARYRRMDWSVSGRAECYNLIGRCFFLVLHEG